MTHPVRSVVVIGAGIGGLSAAVELASRGLDVLVLERAERPGGKLRQLASSSGPVDAGPTVFTMPWVFESLFERGGCDFHRAVPTTRAERIATHLWQDGGCLNLYADVDRSAEEIGRFAGAAEARNYRQFVQRAGRVFGALRSSFLESGKPNPVSLAWRIGLKDSLKIQPFRRLMDVLNEQFGDPRLRQLFGRYATYCGASPYLAPATLMLIPYVEQAGVLYVSGGMYSLVDALAGLARRLGVEIRCGVDVVGVTGSRGRFRLRTREGESLRAATLVANVDAGAIAAGAFGRECTSVLGRVPVRARSLSALTWTFSGSAFGPDLSHHNVCFSTDYRREFDSLRRRRVPADPTVYVCAQDRGDTGVPADREGERFLCLINAPPDGDMNPYPEGEVKTCMNHALTTLERCGVRLQPGDQPKITTPADFEDLFPGSGGAIYGRASHGWMSTFLRAGSRSRLPGLYLAGGSVHPGPGVPMAALSGRLAASALWQDWTSRSRSQRVATPGGISMR